MDKSKITKEHRKENVKGITMNIRVNAKMSKFMKDNGYSPSLIFYEALKELGFKEN